VSDEGVLCVVVVVVVVVVMMVMMVVGRGCATACWDYIV
jgi:hypothetical protein